MYTLDLLQLSLDSLRALVLALNDDVAAGVRGSEVRLANAVMVLKFKEDVESIPRGLEPSTAKVDPNCASA